MSRLPALILDKSRHYNAGVTWKASKTNCEQILANFDQETHDRFLALPFGSLIRARENIEWSGVLVHHILMHRVHSPHIDELQFVIGSKHCRFGLIEFALITGMNFGEVPSLAEREKRRRHQRLKETYFTEFGNKRINVRDLKDKFEKCEEPEDKFKLGLCYFMEASVFSSELSGEVLLDLLFFVDDIDFFIKYPWGHEVYRRTLEGFAKQDLIKHLEKHDKRKGDQPKYTVGGYALALQIWVVECFPEFTPDFAVLQAGPVMFPRILCWQLPSKLSFIKVRKTFIEKQKIRGEPFLRPRTEAEQTYLRTIKCSKRLVVELGLDPAQALDESEGNDEPLHDTQHSTSFPPRDRQQDCLPGIGFMQSVGSVPPPSTVVSLLASMMAQAGGDVEEDLPQEDVRIDEDPAVTFPNARFAGPVLNHSTSQMLLDQTDDEPPPHDVRSEDVIQRQESSATHSGSSFAIRKKRKTEASLREKSKKKKKKRTKVADLAALVSELPIPEEGDEALDPKVISELDDAELSHFGTKILSAGLTLSSSSVYFGHEAFRRLGNTSSDMEKLKGEMEVLKRGNADLQAKVEAREAELQKRGQEYQEALQTKDDEHMANQQDLENHMTKLRYEKTKLENIVHNHPVEVRAAVANAISDFKASAGLRDVLSILLGPALNNGYVKGVDDAKAQWADLDIDRLANKSWYKPGMDKALETRYEEFTRGVDIVRRYTPQTKVVVPTSIPPSESSAATPKTGQPSEVVVNETSRSWDQGKLSTSVGQGLPSDAIGPNVTKETC